MMTGREADAQAAVAAVRALAEQGRVTLELAVAEAPISSPEEAAEKGRVPGHLRRSARLVILVNQEEFDSAEAAERRVRELALAGRLYKADAEVRFEAVYARHQHDRLSFKHPHGGKSKYLEHPVQIARPALRAALEQVMT
jgi:hypothetical protein